MEKISTSNIIFKYRKFDKSSLELFLNRELWFATAATLNDPFEAESSFSEVLDAVWDHYPLPKDIRNDFENTLIKLLNSSGICSFSKARKNQLMWSHYADEHKGICIGFKEKKLTPAEASIYPIDVTYQANYPFKDIIKRFHHFKNFPDLNGLNDITGDILYSILGTKYSSWKYERERRLVKMKSGPLKFNPDAVNPIAFGLRMADRDKDTLYALLSGPEWEHVKWFQSVKSATKYSLEFKSIK